MDERLKFVARVLDGGKMAVLCRDFGISRKTGYKILKRYNDSGLEGLTDRSRRPYRHANQLPFQIEKLIVRAKQDKPSWGTPKIRERLARLYPDVHTPAISTMHPSSDRHGLVKRRKQRRNRAQGTALSHISPGRKTISFARSRTKASVRTSQPGRWCAPRPMPDRHRAPFRFKSPDLLYLQCAGWKGLDQRLRRHRRVEPVRPRAAIEDNLPVMIGRDIGPSRNAARRVIEIFRKSVFLVVGR